MTLRLLEPLAARQRRAGQLVQQRRRVVGLALVRPAAERARRRGSATRRAELARRALGEDPAVLDDRDAVGQRLRLVEVVRREQRRSCRGRAATRTVSHAARRAAGSKPVVGSSRNISSGSPTSASAKSSRRCWPPESVRARRSAASSRPASAITSSTSRGARIQRRPVRDRLAHGQVRVGAAALQHDPDPRAQRAGALAGVVAEHATPSPRVARAVALEDLDGRRLAGAVGPEQAEHLARATRTTPRTASWPS